MAWVAYEESVTSVVSCLLATTPDIAEICANKESWYIQGGNVHYLRPQSIRKAEVINSVITGNGLIVPLGTEFTLSLDKDGNTKLVVLEGQVLVIQFSTRQVMLLNSTQQLAIQQGGNNVVSNTITNFDLKNIDQWWVQPSASVLSAKILLGDRLNPREGAKTIPISLRADISGGQAPYAYLWDMGDGMVKEGESVNYEYARTGLYTVTLRVRDAVGQIFSAQQSVKAEELGVRNPSPESQSIATPSSLFDDVTGTILGALIVFMAVTGAFFRPSRKSQQPAIGTPQVSKSKFRPRNLALLGVFLLFVPTIAIVPLVITNTLMISQETLITTLVVPSITGFTLLLLAPIKLVIDKVRKKQS